MQGDSVREGGIKQTTPKGQTCVPWASIFCCKEDSLIFLCGCKQCITNGYSLHGNDYQMHNPQNYFCFHCCNKGGILSAQESHSPSIYYKAFFLLIISVMGEFSLPLGIIGSSSGVIAHTDKKSIPNISLALQIIILSRFILIPNSM